MFLGVMRSMDVRFDLPETNGVDMIALIEGFGGRIEQVWYEHKYANLDLQFQTVPEHPFIQQVMKATDQILQHAGDGWYFICHLIMYALSPTPTGPYLLHAMLQAGLPPNTEVIVLDEGIESTQPILALAVPRAAKISIPDHATENVGCVVSLLVQHGANIYYQRPKSFDKASSWYDVGTLWTLSYNQNFKTGWLNALKDAGVDVDEYCWEDIRRTKKAIRLRGATRSGVDEQVLELPPISGLRCRPCHRRYCRKHSRGIIDDRERYERDQRCKTAA